MGFGVNEPCRVGQSSLVSHLSHEPPPRQFIQAWAWHISSFEEASIVVLEGFFGHRSELDLGNLKLEMSSLNLHWDPDSVILDSASTYDRL